MVVKIDEVRALLFFLYCIIHYLRIGCIRSLSRWKSQIYISMSKPIPFQSQFLYHIIMGHQRSLKGCQ
ncbi:hypothetical protein AAFF_G00090570 [Aldrovandia affinis]|uniref:Uncharacterized protein n=1 Tax=Aldrovandia affinis TaxID=143900 RepID=A0AAD7VXJ9_9TELE|nr:hypothetical protein AAFF_G00090570 [Aldrovandia affinis]